MGRPAGGMVLPLPFYSPVVAFCHIVHVCYGCPTLATATWQAMGLVYTYIVHIIPKFAEEGCTATLYMHARSHTWFHPWAPMLYSDEIGERDLGVAIKYAPVTSTRQDASISESLKHELYEKFLRKTKKIPTAKIRAPVHRNLVLETCMVAANALWQIVFQRLLGYLVTCQEAGGCKLCMHPATNSVKCTFPSAEPESDVVCVCGSCGSKRGIRHWVPLEVEGVQSWPTMALKSRSKFKSGAARRKDLKGKGKGKGKSDVGPIHRPMDSNPSSVLAVPASEAEDSAASFQGPSDVSDHHRVQLMRQAKLLHVPIVDSDIKQQLVFPKGNSSSSCCCSDGGSSSSLEIDDSEEDDVYVSCGSTVSATGSDFSSSSHESLEPQPQPKKYRCTAVHSQEERVLDVDAMSSDGCPVHMLSEGEYNIHSSN